MPTPSSTLVAFLLSGVRHAASQQFLESWQVAFDGIEKTGFVAENYGTKNIQTKKAQMNVTGNNRMYLVQDWAWATRWRDVTYRHLQMLPHLEYG